MREMVEMKNTKVLKNWLIPKLTLSYSYPPISSISLISLPKRNYFRRLNCYEIFMSPTYATADVFLTALKALPKDQRDAVVRRIAEDPALRQDLFDLALIAERRDEPSRPFREYLADTPAR